MGKWDEFDPLYDKERKDTNPSENKEIKTSIKKVKGKKMTRQYSINYIKNKIKQKKKDIKDFESIILKLKKEIEDYEKELEHHKNLMK